MYLLIVFIVSLFLLKFSFLVLLYGARFFFVVLYFSLTGIKDSLLCFSIRKETLESCFSGILRKPLPSLHLILFCRKHLPDPGYCPREVTDWFIVTELSKNFCQKLVFKGWVHRKVGRGENNLNRWNHGLKNYHKNIFTWSHFLQFK